MSLRLFVLLFFLPLLSRADSTRVRRSFLQLNAGSNCTYRVRYNEASIERKNYSPGLGMATGLSLNIRMGTIFYGSIGVRYDRYHFFLYARDSSYYASTGQVGYAFDEFKTAELSLPLGLGFQLQKERWLFTQHSSIAMRGQLRAAFTERNAGVDLRTMHAWRISAGAGYRLGSQLSLWLLPEWSSVKVHEYMEKFFSGPFGYDRTIRMRNVSLLLACRVNL